MVELAIQLTVVFGKTSFDVPASWPPGWCLCGALVSPRPARMYVYEQTSMTLTYDPFLSPPMHDHFYVDAATQLTVSKVSAYIEIVVNTKLKEKANEDSRQKRLAEGKDVFPMSQAEKVRPPVCLCGGVSAHFDVRFF
jgi:hypothetical protein